MRTTIKEEPILDCIEVRTDPARRDSMVDAVAAHLWWVVLGFILGIVTMTL